MSVVVITGAAGLVGSMLRPRLARPGRTLRVLDIAPLTAGPGEEAIAASVTDMDAMTAACQGADAVIHLAGIPGEASWERISELNINGSYVAFEAARRVLHGTAAAALADVPARAASSLLPSGLVTLSSLPCITSSGTLTSSMCSCT